MAKNIKFTNGVIKRMPDTDAEKIVRAGEGVYVSNTERKEYFAELDKKVRAPKKGKKKKAKKEKVTE